MKKLFIAASIFISASLSAITRQEAYDNFHHVFGTEYNNATRSYIDEQVHDIVSKTGLIPDKKLFMGALAKVIYYVLLQSYVGFDRSAHTTEEGRAVAQHLLRLTKHAYAHHMHVDSWHEIDPKLLKKETFKECLPEYCTEKCINLRNHALVEVGQRSLLGIIFNITTLLKYLPYLRIGLSQIDGWLSIIELFVNNPVCVQLFLRKTIELDEDLQVEEVQQHAYMSTYDVPRELLVIEPVTTDPASEMVEEETEISTLTDPLYDIFILLSKTPY